MCFLYVLKSIYACVLSIYMCSKHVFFVCVSKSICRCSKHMYVFSAYKYGYGIRAFSAGTIDFAVFFSVYMYKV